MRNLIVDLSRRIFMCLLSIHHNMGPFYLSNTPKIYSNKMTIIIFNIVKFLSSH
nr:MAG TPA: hypothetical protein [Caudoviricetes sp.]